jgi:hypothetical protein
VDVLLMALSSLVPAVPVLLVWGVGLGLAALRMQTQRRSSLLLGAGLVGLMLQRVLVWPTVMLAQRWLVDSGWSAASISSLFMGIAVVEGLANALWWSLVLAAVFVKEPTPSEPG